MNGGLNPQAGFQSIVYVANGDARHDALLCHQ
jgi:hypothetical protein